MGTIREEAQAYEAPQTINISLLEKIPVDIELLEGKAKNKDGEEFIYKYAKIDGTDYRIPNSVLGGIKSILKKMPHIKHVCVDREGEGMATRYHVMPYVEEVVSQEKVA